MGLILLTFTLAILYFIWKINEKEERIPIGEDIILSENLSGEEEIKIVKEHKSKYIFFCDDEEIRFCHGFFVEKSDDGVNWNSTQIHNVVQTIENTFELYCGNTLYYVIEVNDNGKIEKVDVINTFLSKLSQIKQKFVFIYIIKEYMMRFCHSPHIWW